MTSSCVSVVALMLCLTSFYVEGKFEHRKFYALWSGKNVLSQGERFRVNGGPFFTTSRNINIEDVITSDGAEANGLICQSDMNITNKKNANWYLHPEDQTTAVDNRIMSGDDKGWNRTRNATAFNYKQVILRRKPAPETALEGRFTCRIIEDGSLTRSIYVLYPSELLPHPIHSILYYKPTRAMALSF